MTKKSPAPAGLFSFPGIFSAALIACAFFFSPAAHAQNAACKNSVCFEQTKTLQGRNFPVRGLADFRYFFMDVYTAALYAPGSADLNNILSGIPKSLILNYHRRIKKEWMIKAAQDRLAANPQVNLPALRSRLNQMNAVYEDVKEGDRYELRYEPGRGTSLYLNGRLKTTIPGEDFQRAYFGIWLSEKPISKKFRDQLFAEPGDGHE